MWISTLLWELCHIIFLNNFPNYFRIATFKNSAKSLLSLFNFILKVCLRRKFCAYSSTSYNEKLSHDLVIPNFWFQDHVTSWDKFDKMCGTFFWKMFPFRWTSVYKIVSHFLTLTCNENQALNLMLNHNGNQASRSIRGRIFRNIFLVLE